MNKLFKISAIFLTALVITGCSQQNKLITVSIPSDNQAANTSTNESAVTSTKIKATTTKGGISVVAPIVTTTIKQEAQIPSKYLLNVAFVQQAPFGNWDAVHEETCEEASMVMVDKYFKKQPLTEQIGEEEMQKLLKWEEERGYQVDLTAAETIKILNSYFGISARLSTDVSIDRIKYEIFKGNLIIIPAAGRELKNPNFKQPGPIYHMLVVKGYDSKNFITNDPGTRKGNSFVYPHQQFINAIHDWNPELAEGGMTDEEMLSGAKVMVIVDGLTK